MDTLAALSLALAQGALPACQVMAEPVAADGIIDRANTMPGPCETTSPPRKLRYDPQTRVVRAQTAIAAGEFIGRAFLPVRPAIGAGDRITITVTLGSVSVTREAVALQPARAGQRFFIRTDDGKVFAAPPLAGTDRR